MLYEVNILCNWGLQRLASQWVAVSRHKTKELNHVRNTFTNLSNAVERCLLPLLMYPLNGLVMLEVVSVILLLANMFILTLRRVLQPPARDLSCLIRHFISPRCSGTTVKSIQMVCSFALLLLQHRVLIKLHRL